MLCIHVICYVYMSYGMYTCHMVCIHVIWYVYMSYGMYTCHMVCIHVFVLISIARKVLRKSVRIHNQYKRQMIGESVRVRCHYNNCIQDSLVYISRLNIYGVYVLVCLCTNYVFRFISFSRNSNLYLGLSFEHNNNEIFFL